MRRGVYLVYEKVGDSNLSVHVSIRDGDLPRFADECEYE